jgi:YfiH family protein
MPSKDFFHFNHIISPDFSVIMSTEIFLSSINDIAENLGYKRETLAIPQQIHSENVLFVNSSGEFEDCDGLITDHPNIVLSLQTADCIPIFLYDMVTGLRGLIHAGWRGVIGGIACNAIELMIKHQSTVDNIQVLLGPSICKHCFEVGAEVAAQFDGNCVIAGKNEKYFADLHAQVSLQLLKYKISENNIHFSKICTFENQDCSSYRRDGENAGRMYSFMGVRNGFN